MAQTSISASYANLLRVVVDLITQVEKKASAPPNEVKASDRENGLAATVVILCATIIEGHVNRRYHFEEIAGDARREEFKKRKRLLSWLRLHLIGSAVSVDQVEEVLCARDMISHAHTWHSLTEPVPPSTFASHRHSKATVTHGSEGFWTSRLSSRNPSA